MAEWIPTRAGQFGKNVLRTLSLCLGWHIIPQSRWKVRVVLWNITVTHYELASMPSGRERPKRNTRPFSSTRKKGKKPSSNNDSSGNVEYCEEEQQDDIIPGVQGKQRILLSMILSRKLHLNRPIVVVGSFVSPSSFGMQCRSSLFNSMRQKHSAFRFMQMSPCVVFSQSGDRWWRSSSKTRHCISHCKAHDSTLMYF